MHQMAKEKMKGIVKKKKAKSTDVQTEKNQCVIEHMK